MAYDVTRPLKRCPSHPGTLLDDLMQSIGKSKTEIAATLDISRQQLYDILHAKKPVSPNVAAKLGKYFGNGATLWLRMQASHDAWVAEHTVDLSKIPVFELA